MRELDSKSWMGIYAAVLGFAAIVILGLAWFSSVFA